MVNDLALCLRKIYKNRYDNDRRVKVLIPIVFQSEEIDNFITEQSDCFAQDVYSKMVEVTNDPDGDGGPYIVFGITLTDT